MRPVELADRLQLVDAPARPGRTSVRAREVEEFSKYGDSLEAPPDRSRTIPSRADPIGTLGNTYLTPA